MFTPYLQTFSYIHSQPLQFAKGAVMLRPDIRVSVSIFAILKCVHKPLVMVKLEPPGIRQAQTSHKPTTKPLNRWITPFFWVLDAFLILQLCGWHGCFWYAHCLLMSAPISRMIWMGRYSVWEGKHRPSTWVWSENKIPSNPVGYWFYLISLSPLAKVCISLSGGQMPALFSCC